MAALVPAVVVVLILATAGASDGAWCVCKPDVSDAVLQKSLDYACGAGADCSTIQQGGACFNPNTVRAHCSYAVNSYYQRKGQSQQACDFSGTATLTPSDPSANGCTFPASTSAAGSSGGNTPTGSSTPTANPGGSSSTGTGTGTGFTPTTGVLGGLGPTGSGGSLSTDSSPGRPPAPPLAVVLILLSYFFNL